MVYRDLYRIDYDKKYTKPIDMKRSLHLLMSVLCLFVLVSSANSQTVIYSEDFEDATSADGWTEAGDASDEASVSRSADGGASGSAALLIQGTNSDGNGGRGFVFESAVASSLDYAGNTSVTLKFDLKLSTALTGTALHLRTDFGGGLVETFDLQAMEALTTDSYTSYSIDFDGVPGDASTFKIGFTLAVGAESGFGGAVLVDNVSLEEQDGSGGGGSGDVINSPVTFETGEFGDGWSWTVFENNDNPALEVIDNPDATGANTSAKVAKFTAKSGGASFAGLKTDDIGKFTLDATNSTVKMMVWKSKISDVGFKFEKADGASTGEIKVANTVTDQWEELTFDFSGVIGNAANEDIEFITIFPDFADGRSDNVIYFDNIMIGDGTGGGGGGGGSLNPGDEIYAQDFNEATDVDDWTVAGDSKSEASATHVADGGTDGSGALQISGTNSDGDGGRGFVFQSGVTTDLDYGGETTVEVKFDLKVVEALVGTALHLRTDFGGGLVETFDIQNLETLSSDAYTTLSIPFMNIPSDASQFQIGFTLAVGAEVDFGGSMLVDNIKVVVPGEPGGGGDGELLVNGDFEDGTTGWTGNALDVRTEGGNSYNFANVEQAGDAFAVNLSQVVPIVQGTNYVLKFDASTGAGNTRTIIAGIGLNEAPFTNDTEEVTLTETTQTFTLNLSAAEFGIANSRVLFDMGAATGVVVLDNVSLKIDEGGSEPDPIALPITFEDDSEDYELEDFGGNTTTIVVDPTNSENKVAQSVKGAEGAASEVWAGTTVANVSGFGALPFDEVNTSLTVRVWSPAADVPVRFKVEDKSNGGISVETEATTTVAEAWETLTFDFSNQAEGTAALNIANTYDKGSLFFNFGTAQSGVTYYWDDVTFLVASSDASLSDLQVDEMTIDGFSPTVYEYTYEVSDTETTVPTVSATAASSTASAAVTQADDLPGTATVTVTAEDGSTQDYTVSFVVVSSNSALSDLTVDGTTVAGFDAATLMYSYTLGADASDVPTVEGTAADDGATVVVTDASSLEGTTTVVVTAEDGESTTTYSITFSLPLGLDDQISLGMYPNPTSESIRLSIPDSFDASEFSVRVIDLDGRASNVKVDRNGSELTVDVRSLSSGIYFLQLENADQTITNKFVKK